MIIGNYAIILTYLESIGFQPIVKGCFSIRYFKDGYKFSVTSFDRVDEIEFISPSDSKSLYYHLYKTNFNHLYLDEILSATKIATIELDRKRKIKNILENYD